MAVEEKQRINISLADKDDCADILKLKHKLETLHKKPYTMAEIVRYAISVAIKQF